VPLIVAKKTSSKPITLPIATLSNKARTPSQLVLSLRNQVSRSIAISAEPNNRKPRKDAGPDAIP
jgi:hypothetical protein